MQALPKPKTNIQLGANELGHSNFAYPVFTKDINAAAWSFLGEYRVTKFGLSHSVWNNLYLTILIKKKSKHFLFCFSPVIALIGYDDNNQSAVVVLGDDQPGVSDDISTAIGTYD